MPKFTVSYLIIIEKTNHKMIKKKRYTNLAKYLTLNRLTNLQKISLIFESRCLFKCKHCFNWKFKDNINELKLKDWLKIISELKPFTNFNTQVILGGSGMAELDNKLYPIISQCNKIGIKTILNSNGFLLNTIILRKLIASGLNHLSLSLDFLDSEKHNKQRGIKYSFEHTLNVVNSIDQQKKISLTLNCVIMKSNLDYIIPLIHWSNSKKNIEGINFQAIVQPFNTKWITDWYKKDAYSSLWPGNDPKLQLVLKEMINLKLKDYKIGNKLSQLIVFKKYFNNPEFYREKGCSIDKVGLKINQFGHVGMCPYSDVIGFAKKSNISKMLLQEKYFNTIKKMNNCKENCMQFINCSFKDEPLLSLNSDTYK